MEALHSRERREWGTGGGAAELRVLRERDRATCHEAGIVSEANAVASEQKRFLDALRVKPPARYPDLPTPQGVVVANTQPSQRDAIALPDGLSIPSLSLRAVQRQPV